jgi:hypothetical protein
VVNVELIPFSNDFMKFELRRLPKPAFIDDPKFVIAGVTFEVAVFKLALVF